MFRSFILAAALLTATATAAPLTRSGVLTASDGVRYQIVRYGDLNLASLDGNQMLYRRIVKSAELVCARNTPVRPTFQADVIACRDAAVERAVQSIGHARLTSVHLAAAAQRRGRG